MSDDDDDIVEFPDKKKAPAINYHELVADAYLDVIGQALTVAADDPTGEYCFEITLDTTNIGVAMPADLREQYPNNMTIIINRRYEKLLITDSGFSVTLYFDGKPARIGVPFKSIMFFYDQIHNFKTLFSGTSDAVDYVDSPTEEPADKPTEDSKAKPDNIVSIDDFKKK